MNRLTQAGVLVQDQLFSTLDPVARRLILPNHQPVVVVDTVGFIHNLPHHLVEAFKATLEGVQQAEVLIHVIDASHPLAREHCQSVLQALQQIQSADKEIIVLLNKIDRIDDPQRIARLQREFEGAVPISAKTGKGIELLLQLLARQLTNDLVLLKVLIPSSHMNLVSQIYQQGEVFHREDRLQGVWLEARVPLALANQVLKLKGGARPRKSLH